MPRRKQCLNLADELKRRRNCRYHLKDVRVESGGREWVIMHTCWDKNTHLVITAHLAGDPDHVASLRPEDCTLLSDWPTRRTFP